MNQSQSEEHGLTDDAFASLRGFGPGNAAGLGDERLRLLLQQMPAVLWTTDRELRFTSSDGAALGTLGLAPGQAIGLTVPEYLTGQTTAVEAHHQALRGKSVSYDAQMHQRTFRSRVEPLHDPKGRIVGVIGVAQDVTDQQTAEAQVRRFNAELEERVAKRTAELHAANEKLSQEVAERGAAEQARHQTERVLESILENTTAVVYLKDLESRYLLVNRQFERIFAVDRESLVGQDQSPVGGEEEIRAARANDRTVLKAGRPMQFEERIIQEGQAHDYLSIKFPLFDTQGKAYAVGGISTDITARKQAEQRASRHQQESAHAARLSTMGEMASGLAHEVNQPLAAIANYAQGALEWQHRGQLEHEKLIRAFEQISTQSQRAGQIIHRLREFVKKGEPYRQATDLNQVIHDALGLAQHETREAKVQIALDLHDPIPSFSGEAIQIEQVILNLLRNALDAVTQSSGEPKVRLRTGHDRQRRKIVAEIADNGQPISDQTLSQLFEPFFTTKADGMGVGLNISLSIIEAHNGKLRVRRNSKGGLTFRIELPATDSDQAPPLSPLM